jgi:hypothetical protein
MAELDRAAMLDAISDRPDHRSDEAASRPRAKIGIPHGLHKLNSKKMRELVVVG